MLRSLSAEFEPHVLVNATGWSGGLEVTSRGIGVMSHAGLVPLRELADRTGLTAGLSAALPSLQGGHDRGRVFADLECAAHPTCWIEKAHVAELTGLLPEGPAVTS